MNMLNYILEKYEADEKIYIDKSGNEMVSS